jgi:hypothetical protein
MQIRMVSYSRPGQQFLLARRRAGQARYFIARLIRSVWALYLIAASVRFSSRPIALTLFRPARRRRRFT